ncbi:MAG: hypothetical protein FWG10_13175 [Eubacteriaceae bacterium]|nr:hypothetical protein [Eubacteriaceae bacterium]
MTHKGLPKRQMGIVDAEKLPVGDCESKTIAHARSTSWATTGSYNAFAKNHCAAVLATNLALYFAHIGYPQLKENNTIDATFFSLYKLIGNGPVARLAPKAARYFSGKETILNYKPVHSQKLVAEAIDNNRLCSVLISDCLFNWHWVICVGYVRYKSGRFFMQVVDGWNDTVDRYYEPNSGSAWMYATQFWASSL